MITLYVPFSQAPAYWRALYEIEMKAAEQKPWWCRWWWKAKVRRHYGKRTLKTS